jgi:aminoglycoside 2'-N-acetyltransferase I
VVTPAADVRVRRLPTGQLGATEITEIRALLAAAFGDDPEERFTEDDWQHALGGIHFMAVEGGRVVGHAAVVERDIRVAGRPIRTGYVEAVATAVDRQRSGIGTAIMAAVAEHLAGFELGALGTGEHAFYERLGWVTWLGPSSVRAEDGERPTPDEDGYIMVLRTPLTPQLDPRLPISCEWRPGDVW